MCAVAKLVDLESEEEEQQQEEEQRRRKEQKRAAATKNFQSGICAAAAELIEQDEICVPLSL
jgi:hypothetical protein